MFGGGGGEGHFQPRPRLEQPLDAGRWPDLAQNVEQLRRDFEKLESDRESLLKDLGETRRGFEQERMDPAAVLRRQQIENQLGQLHESIEQQRQIQEQAVRVLRLVEGRKNQVRQALESAAKAQQPDDPTLRRLERWKKAMDALDQARRQQWANALLGETLGPLTLAQIDEERKAGGEARTLGERVRQRWMQRQQQVDELERGQRELFALVERQSREIDRLRRLVEGRAGDQATTPTTNVKGKARGR